MAEPPRWAQVWRSPWQRRRDRLTDCPRLREPVGCLPVGSEPEPGTARDHLRGDLGPVGVVVSPAPTG